jgi:hypothetical protein
MEQKQAVPVLLRRFFVLGTFNNKNKSTSFLRVLFFVGFVLQTYVKTLMALSTFLILNSLEFN